MGHTVGSASIERQAEPRVERNGVSVYRLDHHNDFWLEDWPQHNAQQRRMQKLKQQWNFEIERQFEKVLDEFRPDILNSHSLVDVTTLVWRAAHRRGIPVVHTLCDYDLMCGNAAMFRNGAPCDHIHLGCQLVNFSKKFTQRYVDAVASVGTDILSIHVSHGLFQHIPEQLRRVIFYSSTVPGGDPVERRRMDRSGRPMTFGYIGRINTEKGVGTMIDAFKMVGPGNWRCLIAGKAMDDSIERFTAQAGDLPIEFIGWATPKNFFEQIDVLICPSYWAEPSPRAIYEAYQMGVPVIGAASGGIPELIGDQEWLFKPGSASQLADRIRGVLGKSRAELPTEAEFGGIIERSSSRHVGENYLRLYDDVLDRKRSGSQAH